MVDPLSVGGLALGSASLAVQVFEGAIKGFKYFEIAADAENRHASLRLRLQLEFSRLLDWGDAAGIRDSQTAFDKRMKVNGVIVMALLSEIGSLLKSMRYISLDAKDGQSVGVDTEPDLLHRSQPMQEVNFEAFKSIFESASVPKEQRTYPKGFNHFIGYAAGIREIGKHPRKSVKWAVRDEEKFGAMLTRLKQLTDYLHQTLGEDKMNVLLHNTRDSYLAVLQLTKDVAVIKTLLAVATPSDVELSAGDDSASIFSQAETLVSEEISAGSKVYRPSLGHATVFQRLAEFRELNQKVYSDSWIESEFSSKLKLPDSLGKLNTLEIEHQILARWGPKPVWLEGKEYDDKDIEPYQDEQRLWHAGPSKKVEKNAKRLVALLQAKQKPIEFGVPYCHGYYVDEASHRFLFVYEALALSGSAPVKRKSLLEAFDEQPWSTTGRVCLAQRLSICLLYLHTTNWLHKALRSSCILFFSERGDIRDKRPYISSFEYSRPDQNLETYQGPPETPEYRIYCHPDYLGRSGYFRKSFDIYSLGIILLEIAYWKPAKHILANDLVDIERSNIREHLLSHDLPADRDTLGRVRQTMGDKYYNATRACIGGLEYFNLPKDVDQTDPVIAALLQQAYLRLVVDVLDSISV